MDIQVVEVDVRVAAVGVLVELDVGLAALEDVVELQEGEEDNGQPASIL